MTGLREQKADHFAIGAVGVSLCTPIRRLRREYAALYEDFRVPQAPDHAVRVDVRPSRWSLRHRRRFQVSVNGRDRFAPTRFDEVLPYVEWAINWELALVMPQFLQIHASSVEMDGQGVMLPGISGSGKSTLTTGLLARGWRYLCDEFALIDSDTLILHPFPRAICIKQPGFPVLESLGIKLKGARHYHKGTKGNVSFVSASAFGAHTVARPCPIRYVVFPKYARGRSPVLVPISRAEAAFALHAVCFNLFECRGAGSDVLANAVRGASCYRLISGDLQETCDLLGELVGGSAQRRARSA